MGRIVTQLKLINFMDPDKSLTVSALVDTALRTSLCQVLGANRLATWSSLQR